jgi:hypothetical protein
MSLALLAAVTPLLVAAPAHASGGSCDIYTLCLWEDPNYAGDKYWIAQSGTGQQDWELNWLNGDNEISSVTNWTDKWAVLYDNDGYSGTKICIGPDVTRADLNSNYGFDNEAESVRLYPSRPIFC